MTRYLLDTNIPLYLEYPESPFHAKVLEQFRHLDDHDEVFFSVLSLYELYYGAQSRLNMLEAKLASLSKGFIRDMVEKFQMVSLSEAGASAFGTLKVAYKTASLTKVSQKGNIKKHDVDLMIASLAVAHNMVVVSNDRIFIVLQALEPKLMVENWAV